MSVIAASQKLHASLIFYLSLQKQTSGKSITLRNMWSAFTAALGKKFLWNTNCDQHHLLVNCNCSKSSWTQTEVPEHELAASSEETRKEGGHRVSPNYSLKQVYPSVFLWHPVQNNRLPRWHASQPSLSCDTWHKSTCLERNLEFTDTFILH